MSKSNHLSNDQTVERTPYSPSITGIECDGLFGQYTYKLYPDSASKDSIAKLLLLYGDNGSGKTTIAQLLFHLLSRQDGRGHRSFLGMTKFRRFCVYLDNGVSFAAERSGNLLQGPYQLTATAPSGEVSCLRINTNEDFRVGTGGLDENALGNLFKFCGIQDLDIYFLSDNRVLQCDLFEKEEDDELMYRQQSYKFRVGRVWREEAVPSRTRELQILPSIIRLEGWLRRQAIRASRASEVNTSNIYVEIVKRIAGAQLAEPSGKLPKVIDSLEKLALRSTAFSVFGLEQPIPIEVLRAELKRANESKHDVLANILEPYVDSIRSRLDAYSDLQRRLKSFIEIVNALYRRKEIRISVSEGVHVADDNGDILDIDLLSSGEKQLLLLLSNILVATTAPSLVIIDEPELSLNVKWQRQLVDSLLSLVDGSHVQFVMATHSIEVLARHKNRIMKLDDKNLLGPNEN